MKHTVKDTFFTPSSETFADAVTIATGLEKKSTLRAIDKMASIKRCQSSEFSM